MLHSITSWLGDLPLGSLYIAIAALSAFENFFPPFPSDAVIAFGSFLAERAHGNPFLVDVFAHGATLLARQIWQAVGAIPQAARQALSLHVQRARQV